jgi:hypothetical protein
MAAGWLGTQVHPDREESENHAGHFDLAESTRHSCPAALFQFLRATPP